MKRFKPYTVCVYGAYNSGYRKICTIICFNLPNEIYELAFIITTKLILNSYYMFSPHNIYLFTVYNTDYILIKNISC